MATLGEVKAVYSELVLNIALYGVDREFLEESERRFRAIGDALRQDGGLSVEEAMGLPENTVLSESAQARYEEWRDFLRQHSVV